MCCHKSKAQLRNGSSKVGCRPCHSRCQPKRTVQQDNIMEKGNTEVVPQHFNNWPNSQGFESWDEQREPIELTVKGVIPSWASGTLYRTGPGGRTIETDKGTTFKLSHWFDGFSQVHRFQIIPQGTPDGVSRVVYNSRHTVDKFVENIRKTGSLNDFSFAQKRDPCQSLFKKFMSYFNSSTDANIGVTVSTNFPGLPPISNDERSNESKPHHASGIQTLTAKTDSARLKRLDPETLEPVGVTDQRCLHPDLSGPFSAAHAKSDPETGDVFNYNLSIGRTSVYRVFHVSAATGETTILATVSDAPAAYLHSLSLTRNFVILCVWNSHYAMGGAKVLWERNILDGISAFDASKPAKWYVIDRHHGQGVVASFESDPFFCFHTINAWEEEAPPAYAEQTEHTDIVVDMSVYENLDVLKRFYYENILSDSPAAAKFVGSKGDSARAQLRRYRLPGIPAPAALPFQAPDLSSSSGHPKQAKIDFTAPRSSSGELPTLNPKYLTRPNRYIYVVTDSGEQSVFMDGLGKYDTLTGELTRWCEHGQNPGEAIFIPAPSGKNEDEDNGVLLSVVLDGHRGKSYLLCLNARDMTELGRAEIDMVVGFGFHGTFF
ncbi:hypothetical protein L228DRAFT_218379, partial [Xylona heveae TC161]